MLLSDSEGYVLVLGSDDLPDWALVRTRIRLRRFGRLGTRRLVLVSDFFRHAHESFSTKALHSFQGGVLQQQKTNNNRLGLVTKLRQKCYWASQEFWFSGYQKGLRPNYMYLFQLLKLKDRISDKKLVQLFRFRSRVFQFSLLVHQSI